MGRRFGSASVQYGDWHGTVSLDDPDEYGELERIAGVDPNDWRICAIDISGASGTGIRASVLAVRHELIEDFGDWERVARDNDGAIPATEFELREGTALALLGTFKRSNIRASLREAIEDADLELEIVETVQPPEDLPQP
jgi:hypothetical protein